MLALGLDDLEDQAVALLVSEHPRAVALRVRPFQGKRDLPHGLLFFLLLLLAPSICAQLIQRTFEGLEREHCVFVLAEAPASLRTC